MSRGWPGRYGGVPKLAPGGHPPARPLDLKDQAADQDAVDVELIGAARLRLQPRGLPHPFDDPFRIDEAVEHGLERGFDIDRDREARHPPPPLASTACFSAASRSGQNCSRNAATGSDPSLPPT